MESLKQSGGFSISEKPLSAIRGEFAAGRSTVDETAATIKSVLEADGYLLDPHSAIGVKVARENVSGAAPMVVLATAHPAKFPDAVKAASGVEPQLPAWLSDLMQRKKLHSSSQRPENRGRIRSPPFESLKDRLRDENQSGNAGSSLLMGVEVTRLSNGLTIATDTMSHVESVALGIWVKAGARNEATDRHGIAHLLEHMAFKGTENVQRGRSHRILKMSAARSMPPPASRPHPIMRVFCATMCHWQSTFFPTS